MTTKKRKKPLVSVLQKSHAILLRALAREKAELAKTKEEWEKDRLLLSIAQDRVKIVEYKNKEADERIRQANEHIQKLKDEISRLYESYANAF